jgi:hypothetical protein
MAQQILKINAPSTTTKSLSGTSAADDYFTLDRSTGSSTFSPQVVITDFFATTGDKLSVEINDVVKKQIQTIQLPSLKDSNAIEYFEVLGSLTAIYNGQYKIVAPGDYSKASDKHLDIYGTTSNDTSTAQTSMSSVASLWGALGDDNLTGAGGAGVLYGGPGNNTLRGIGSEYDIFRAFTADKANDTIIEDSKTGAHQIQIYLPSTTIKSWTFKQVGNDLVGFVTDANESTYNFTIKDQYIKKTIQTINLFSEGVAGTNGNAFLTGGDLTDTVSGSSTHAVVAGTSENDIFNLSTTTRPGTRVFGNEGNDDVIAKKDSLLRFYAGPGTDSVSYPDLSSNNKITVTSSSVKNLLPTGKTSTDYLESVERIKFTDKAIAYDVGATQAAGQTVEILNAAFGKSSLSNKSFVGIGLSLFDSNMSMSDVATLAVSTGLVSAKDNTSFVKAIWQNVVGSPIDDGNLTTFVGMLDNGTFTQPSLLALAATTDLNKTAVNLVGLAQTGIDYTPAG